MPQKQQTQTFNDGIVNIYEIRDNSDSGDMPNETPVLKYSNIRFHKRIVGISRYWEAKRNDVQIDRLIRIPKVGDVFSGYIVVINGVIDGSEPSYKVEQAQEPENEYPPVLDLSLSRLEGSYGTE